MPELGACPNCGVKPITIKFACDAGHRCANCDYELTRQDFINLGRKQ